MGATYTKLGVDNVVLNHGIENFLIGRDIDCLCRFNGAVDVCLCYFSVFDFNHTLRIKAADVVACDTCGNVGNFGIRHQLGIIDRLPDGLDGGIDIGYHARAQAP